VTTPLAFEYQAHAQRVVFGPGVARTELAAAITGLGRSRVLLVASGSSQKLAEELGAGLPVVATFTGVRPHVPFAVAEAARELAGSAQADVIVSIGGGSTTGTAKAVALTTGLPIVAIPTTYAGSEATPVWGLTDDGRKQTGVDPVVLPTVVLYDPELTLSLPPGLTVASGLNALAHCVDALWAPRANPVSSALAVEGIRALGLALPLVHADGSDVEARAGALYGAYLSAVAFAGAGSGLHHKICHVLGGAYNLPHAAMHAVMLPHVLAFNAPAAPEAAASIARALAGAGSGSGPGSGFGPEVGFGAGFGFGTGKTEDAVPLLLDLYERLAAPRALRELDPALPEAALPEAAELVAAAAPKDHPRPFGPVEAGRLLRRAWAGDRPSADLHGEQSSADQSSADQNSADQNEDV
jgi:alcohol dehydrogenase class IV